MASVRNGRLDVTVDRLDGQHKVIERYDYFPAVGYSPMSPSPCHQSDNNFRLMLSRRNRDSFPLFRPRLNWQPACRVISFFFSRRLATATTPPFDLNCNRKRWFSGHVSLFDISWNWRLSPALFYFPLHSRNHRLNNQELQMYTLVSRPSGTHKIWFHYL